MNNYDYARNLMNYTQIEHLYGTEEYNLSPRFGSSISIPSSDTNVGHVFWIDLEREAEISVGVSWPYPDL